jgi:hypothetical protein
MSAILELLLNFVPMIPKLVEAGTTTLDIYRVVQNVIDQNRSPAQAEWDHLEQIIKQDQALIRDMSRDV